MNGAEQAIAVSWCLGWLGLFLLVGFLAWLLFRALGGDGCIK